VKGSARFKGLSHDLKLIHVDRWRDHFHPIARGVSKRFIGAIKEFRGVVGESAGLFAVEPAHDVAGAADFRPRGSHCNQRTIAIRDPNGISRFLGSLQVVEIGKLGLRHVQVSSHEGAAGSFPKKRKMHGPMWNL
jgi:hypothetical protein